MKKIPLKAAQGKVIVKLIEVPQKKKQLLVLDQQVSLSSKSDIDVLMKSYDDHPLQAIVISNGSAIQLRDGLEYNELEYGDLVIIGIGSFDWLIWGGVKYAVIRTSLINAIIKKDDEEYPVYAAKCLYDVIDNVQSTIVN